VYRIKSASIVSGKTRYYVHHCSADSAAVNRSHYTGWSKDIRAPLPAARTHTGGGWRGGRWKETVT